jgi:hypothetical protein
MFEELEMPGSREKEDIFAIAGDILTAGIETFVRQEKLPENFYKELAELAEILQVRASRPLYDKSASMITHLLALQLKYIATNQCILNEDRYEELAEKIFGLIDKEIIKKDESFEMLDELFPLFSPLCVMMCLANTSAVIFPRFTYASDKELLSLIQKQYSLPKRTDSHPSVELRYHHPFYLIAVHKETNMVLESFSRVIRAQLLPRKDGSYASMAHTLFMFFERMLCESDARVREFPEDEVPFIDASQPPEVQDREFHAYVNYCAMDCMAALRDFDKYLSEGASRKPLFDEVVSRVRIVQDTLVQNIRNIFSAGSAVYDSDSLHDSVLKIVPMIIDDNRVEADIKDLLVCFLPGGLFPYKEAAEFWDKRISARRDYFIAAYKRNMTRFKALLSSDDIELKRELKYLMLEINTPLRSLATIGNIDYPYIINSLGVPEQKINEYSVMEYQAALDMYLMVKDDEFYENLFQFV